MWPPQARDSAQKVIEALMRERGLERTFTEPVRRAAESARDRGFDSRHGGRTRRDLRDLPTFTVDPASARDFDDAVSAEVLGGGAIRVWVHIADVSAYVAEGSGLDLEARRRATSVYVPGAVEPMLPPALSDDACSLLPGAERPAVTTELELEEGAVVRASFYRSVIRSDARLDYERVDRVFTGRERAEEPWGEPLAAARQAAATLQEVRARRGALVIGAAEPEFSFDRHGNVSLVQARVSTEAHRLIEHLMIATNEAVARLLEQRHVPCLYRVHERPEPESVRRLVEQLASLEVPTPPIGELISPFQAADLVGRISTLVEAHVRRTGHGLLALGTLVLRSLKQAYYTPKNLGHAGLGSRCYCHFTSPIRRYPDLVCHRALLAAVGAGERAPRGGELAELGAWTSERERHAMAIERAADDVARCFVLEQALHEGGSERTFTGEVVGLISAGAFVAFGGPGAGPGAGRLDTSAGSPSGPGGLHVFEGMLPVRSLRSYAPSGGSSDARGGRPAGRGGGAGDWWELNELGTILRGEHSGRTVRLGDEIAVRVARVEVTRGRVDLIPEPEAEFGG